MPWFAFLTAVDTNKFKENPLVQCTSSGRRLQSCRKRQENNNIMKEAVTRRRLVEKAAIARALQRMEMMEVSKWPDSDDEL